MLSTRTAPVRLFVAALLSLGLAAGLFAMSATARTAPRASATVTAVTGDHALAWARSRKGSPYVYGATGPHRFDCSGLTRWVYARLGKSLPHSSARQARDVVRISRSRARPGDLVFFYGYGGVYHVGIWAGHGYIWHAPFPGAHVRRQHLWTSHVFFGRVR
jgi:cell wall-associated NlpC family hydrolase